MLTSYNRPGQRYITCPSQDLIYGFGVLDLSRDAVVMQVPDFGERFFVFQATDQRTDAFSEIGSIYGSKPGFYLLAGPDWRGRAPAGIAAMFRSQTGSAASSRACSWQTTPPTIRQCSLCSGRSWSR